MIYKSIPLLLILLCSSQSAWAIVDHEGENNSLSVDGIAKIFFLVSHYENPLTQDVVISPTVPTSLRLNIESHLGEFVSLEAAYQVFATASATPTNTDGLALGVSAPNAAYRLVDFDSTLENFDGLLLQHNLDRLNVAISTEKFELRIGRQALGHGSAFIFPTTDIFGPFGVGNLDNEFKPGVDGVRATFLLNESSELEAYAVFREVDSVIDSIFLARYRKSFTGLDVSIVAGLTLGSPTFMLDLSAELFGATVYGEFFYRYLSNDSFRRNATGPIRNQPHELRATLGFQYIFGSRLSWSFEVHINGQGGRIPGLYFAALGRPSYQIRETYLLGKVYGGTAFGLPIGDLATISLAMIRNWRDGSALITPGVGFDFAQNVSVNIGALIALGEKPNGLAPNSEFGLYPSTMFADVRLYF